MRTFKNIESYLIIRADTLYRIIVTILAGLVMVASSINGEHITSVIYYGSLTLSLAAFGNSWSICIISWAVSEASLMFYYFVTDSGYETVLLTSLTSIVILAVAFPVRKSLGIGDMNKPFKINCLLVAGSLAGFLVTLSSRGDLSIWKAIISLWLMLPTEIFNVITEFLSHLIAGRIYWISSIPALFAPYLFFFFIKEEKKRNRSGQID